MAVGDDVYAILRCSEVDQGELEQLLVFSMAAGTIYLQMKSPIAAKARASRCVRFIIWMAGSTKFSWVQMRYRTT